MIILNEDYINLLKRYLNYNLIISWYLLCNNNNLCFKNDSYSGDDYKV